MSADSIAEKIEKLADKFDPTDIEWRIQRAGMRDGKPWAMVLAYVTSRAVQQRLDDVCGPFGWQNRFVVEPDHAITCGIGIKCGDEWVWKYDAAEATDIEAIKGGRSGAMKRAGVHWGIGRYLYNLDATFAECSLEKPPAGEKELWYQHQDKSTSTWFHWKTPTLPKWATPSASPDTLAGHNEAVRDNFKAIGALKEFLGDGSLKEAAEIWCNLPDDIKRKLWVAPSKGGIMTTKEMAVLKSDVFSQARADYFAEKNQ